mgnify:FL=1
MTTFDFARWRRELDLGGYDARPLAGRDGVAVLRALGNHANADGAGARPTKTQLARATNLSEPAVTRALATLTRLGLIEKAGEAHPRLIGGGVEYRLLMPTSKATTTPSKERDYV